MIAIKDMEMPKSCSECSFKANDYVCGLLDYAFSCNRFKERNYNCPLVEIITCKESEKAFKYDILVKQLFSKSYLSWYSEKLGIDSYNFSNIMEILEPEMYVDKFENLKVREKEKKE